MKGANTYGGGLYAAVPFHKIKAEIVIFQEP